MTEEEKKAEDAMSPEDKLRKRADEIRGSQAETDTPERLVPFQEAIRDGFPALVTAMEKIADAMNRIAGEVEAKTGAKEAEKKTRM